MRNSISHIELPQDTAIVTSLSKIKNQIFSSDSRLFVKAHNFYQAHLEAHIGLAVNLTAISALVVVVVVAGSLQTEPATDSTVYRQQATGLGGIDDQTANAYAAAYIANEADLAVAELANQRAQQLSHEATATTEADAYLNKPQLVSAHNPVGDQITTYSVKANDTIQKIANRFDISANTIRWANNLSESAELSRGQQLKILPVSGVLHTVREGDTVEKLANKYDANATQIATYNDTEINGLSNGQNIIIPEGRQPEPTPAAPTGPTRSSLYSQYASFTPSFNGNGYSYGYCTWYVASQRSIPSNWGNAISWLYNAQASGYGTGSQPKQGAVAWEPIGGLGHVSYVEKVTADGMLLSEMNYRGWGVRTTRFISNSEMGHFQFIY